MSRPDVFALPARILHWTMAAMILAMLLIGVGMISTTTARYPELLAWHRPIGIAILALALIRVFVRLTHRPPPLPGDLPAPQVLAAKGSHIALYALMLAMPLIGWAMQSAGGYPVTLWKGFDLPPILPHDIHVYGWLRFGHGLLAYAFFFVILAHIGAALFHGLVRRDGVLQSMTGGVAAGEAIPVDEGPEPALEVPDPPEHGD